MKSVSFHVSTKNLPCILSTFERNLVTKNFQKSPSLVALSVPSGKNGNVGLGVGGGQVVNMVTF